MTDSSHFADSRRGARPVAGAIGRRRPIAPAWLLALASLYSSAGSVELPADNIISHIEKAARTQLAQQAAAAGLVEPQFEVVVARTGRVLPACGQTVTIEALDVRQSNRMRFAAVCAGAAGWKYDFVARAQVTARVAVAAAALPAGRALAADEVALERRDVSMVADSVADPAAVVGLASRRSLRAGELLRSGQMAAPALVKRGEAVQIVARRGAIEVSMAGEALDGGAQDAVVRVRNANSGAVIRARVVAAGTVEPLDLPGRIQSSD